MRMSANIGQPAANASGDSLSQPAVDTSGAGAVGLFHARTLINVGVFTAIYVVIMFASAMLGILNPVMMFVGWLVGLLLDGTVIALFVARTRSFGAFTLLALLVGVFMVFSGHVWYTVVGTTIFGFIGDLIARSGDYRKPSRIALSYAVFSLWLVLPLFPIFYQAEAYFAEIAQSMGAEYTQQMQALFTPWVLGLWAVVVFAFAWLCGWIGTRLLQKHFQTAGLA